MGGITTQGSTLKKGTYPTPDQSVGLVIGAIQTVENWSFGNLGLVRDGSVTIDPKGLKIWEDFFFFREEDVEEPVGTDQPAESTPMVVTSSLKVVAAASSSLSSSSSSSVSGTPRLRSTCSIPSPSTLLSASLSQLNLKGYSQNPYDYELSELSYALVLPRWWINLWIHRLMLVKGCLTRSGSWERGSSFT